MDSLTQKIVDSIKPAHDISFLFDDAIPNFGVRIMPSGTASYFIKYRVKDGPYRTHTIDRTDRITLKEARAKATEILAQTRKGLDPKAYTHAGTSTVSELLNRYMDDHAKKVKKPSSIKSDKHIIEGYLKPKFGAMKIGALKRAHVLDFRNDMKPKPIMANRCLALLSKAMNLAELWGLRPEGSNPVRLVKRYGENVREVSIEDDDLIRIARAIDEHPNRRDALALKLLLATGCRKSEIVHAHVTQLYLAERTLILPDSKTGKGRIHLNAMALEIIEEARRIRAQKDGFIFGSARHNIQRSWKAIRKKANVAEIHIHDLRHIFGSIAHEEGSHLKTVSKLLRHKKLSTTEKYIHGRKTTIKDASEKTGEALSRYFEAA